MWPKTVPFAYQPILGYGCEVWAPYLLRKLNDLNLLSMCDKFPGETLHVKVCKIMLGVHRKSTNNAVRGELGCYPLLIFMLGLSVKYWWKLNNNCYKGLNSLVINALADNRKLCDSGIYTWSTGIKKVLHLIGRLDVWERPLMIKPNSFSSTITENITLQK